MRDEGQVTTEAEMGGLQLQARTAENCQLPPEAKKRQGKIPSPRVSGGVGPADTLSADLGPPEM